MASINMIKQLIEISEGEHEKHRKEVDNLTQRIEEANCGEITTQNYAILNSVIDRYEEDLIQKKESGLRRITSSPRGGNVFLRLRQEESRLIIKYDTVNHGLNKDHEWHFWLM
ncbi:hypothetical protein NDU88_006188 [Pleurodeles waltl]|uniref:Uncharacterized protein n=1 Tax=Pleurodeles waltl TaxID=8319 RepID=A0AAV7TZJ7_PLEWA|nr:hypothetical protein NDU88_006188 [Pleurodeles waltl]